MSIKENLIRDIHSGSKGGSRGAASLPDMSRQHLDEREGNTVDNLFTHSVAMVDRGFGNGGARKRDKAEGGETGRFRILSENGLNYQRGLHSSNRTKAMRKVNRMLKYTNELMKDPANIDKVKDQLLEVDKLFSEVMEAHGKYHTLIDGHDDRLKSSKWMNDNDAVVFGFRSFTNKWISKHNEHQNEPDSNADRHMLNDNVNNNMNLEQQMHDISNDIRPFPTFLNNCHF